VFQPNEGNAEPLGIIRTGKQLVGYTIAEIKSRIAHEGDRNVDWRKIT
jgi:hypothetical protein